MIHFHSEAGCLVCLKRFEYSTPIPHLLVLSSVCESCREVALIGTDDMRPCITCVQFALRREGWNIEVVEGDQPMPHFFGSN